MIIILDNIVKILKKTRWHQKDQSKISFKKEKINTPNIKKNQNLTEIFHDCVKTSGLAQSNDSDAKLEINKKG